MTTQEAYKTALKLYNEGTRAEEISLSLARSGYVSSKTGRKLGVQSIWDIIRKAKNGVVPKNRMRRSRKSKAHLYQPRVRNREAAPTLGTQPTAANGGLIAIANTETATNNLKSAYDELNVMATRHRTLANALDTLLAAVR